MPLRDILKAHEGSSMAASSTDSACCREATLEESLAKAISRFCLVAVLAEEG
jgi:hypothetical protein